MHAEGYCETGRDTAPFATQCTEHYEHAYINGGRIVYLLVTSKFPFSLLLFPFVASPKGVDSARFEQLLVVALLADEYPVHSVASILCCRRSFSSLLLFS